MRPDVLFVLPHLGPGGAQRVVSIVSAHLIAEGRRVAVLTLLPRKTAHDLHEDVLWLQPPAILRLSIAVGGELRGVAVRVLPDSIRHRLSRWWAHRSVGSGGTPNPGSLPWTDRLRVGLIAGTIRRIDPAVVMSLLTKANILTLLATTDMQTRVVISERNRLARPEPARIRRLRASLYPKCPRVTANAPIIVEELQQELGVAHARLLPNVIRQGPEEGTRPDREHLISVVARLVPQKRVDLALEAFVSIHETDQRWRLQVIGDGPESRRLQQLAASLFPPGACSFAGHLRDPQPALERSRILILPSAFEGTSNALLEAMACGVVPLVSEEADPREELVVEGKTGRRFGPKSGGISTQLLRLASHDNLAHLAGRARRKAEEFTWEHQRATWNAHLFG